jgi:hypothetical protein
MTEGKIESIEEAVAHAKDRIKPFENSDYPWQADEENWLKILRAIGLDFDEDSDRAEQVVREIVKSVVVFHLECDLLLGEPLTAKQLDELEKHLKSLRKLTEACADHGGIMHKLLRTSCHVGELAKVLTGSDPEKQTAGGFYGLVRVLKILNALESDLTWVSEKAAKRDEKLEEVPLKRLCHRLKAIHRTHERRAVVKANYPNGAPGGIYANNFVKISLECIGDVVNHSAVKNRVKGDMPDLPSKRAMVPELARHTGWFDLKLNQGD